MAGPAAAVALLVVLFAASPVAAWPEYQPPGPGDSRSPCPALNTLANHGYINRNGRDVGIPSIAKAIKQVFNVDLPTGLAIGGGALTFTRLPSHAVLGLLPEASRVTGDTAPLAFKQLDELFAPGRTFFDASFTRDDSAPSHPPPRRPNPARINVTLAFTEATGGYLTPESCARARPAIYKLSRAANPDFSWPPLAPLVHAGDCVLSTTVLGEGTRIRADYLRSFWADERIPDGWTPRTTPVSTAELALRLIPQLKLIYAQPGCSQGC